MLGRHDTPGEPGELSHAQALAAALSGTMGMGNISGVALAIAAGGPGAVFWMWMSALVGISTKFFTCTLGVMYRGKDSAGQLQGGPMYIIREALPRAFFPLAILFSLAGLIGTLPIFQANQLTALIRDNLFAGQAPGGANLLIGCVIAAVVGSVVFGGLQRVASVAVTLLPLMMVTYMAMTLYLLLLHSEQVPGLLASIVTDAFNPQAVGGGLVGVILIGVSRGVFSNEAGVGTEVMAHGAARTNEPVREGLVAMLGPVADTLIVCTCTALVILLAGTWRDPGDLSGITLTANAFRQDLGSLGSGLLLFVTLILASTTHVYHVVLRGQMLWVSVWREAAKLLPLVFCAGGHFRCHGQHRCRVQPDFRLLRPDGHPHHGVHPVAGGQGADGGAGVFPASPLLRGTVHGG